MDTTHFPVDYHRGTPRILVFAPTSNDAPVTAEFLSKSGHQVNICHDMARLCNEAETGCDMILLAEETLNEDSVGILGQMVVRQAPWSDIPIALITSGGDANPERLRILARLGQDANINLLERPFRRGTLLSAVQVALRARQRQYYVRDLLEERKNAQSILEKLVQERTSELTDTNEQLETLVYSIAHDLRAPLRSMQAYAKILLDDYTPTLDETAARYAQRIVKSAERMDALVLDLLAYGKTARANLELEKVDLEDVWNSALALFEQDIFDLSAFVTTLRPLPCVYASPTLLSQILANLLGNALKFVPKNVAPVITFRGEDRGESIRISIQDNGVGIAPEYHDRIFRVFERLRPDNSEGTGIGLAIVRKGVERMGGRVGVESAPPKKGSLFWIELKNSPPFHSMEIPERVHHSLNGHTILMVEDNDDDVFIMQRAFRKANISNPLQTVPNGEEALNYLEGHGQYTDRTRFPFPIITFLDLNMPKKSGFEVLEYIRQHPPFVN